MLETQRAGPCVPYSGLRWLSEKFMGAWFHVKGKINNAC